MPGHPTVLDNSRARIYCACSKWSWELFILVNGLGDLSLPRKSVVWLTDRPDMTIAVYHGCKTTTQQQFFSFKSLHPIEKRGKTENGRVIMPRHKKWRVIMLYPPNF